MGMMGEMIGEVRALVQSLSTSIQNAPATISQADSTVVDLRRSARLLAEFLEENRQSMQNTVEAMEASAASFRATMDKNTHRVDSTLERASQASERILVAAAKFDSLSQQLKTLAGQVERGEGTLGALMQDPSLYDDLKRTAAEIDALVADIRANPKKYVNVSFKLF
jgi:phospholipid/cholesterol/gamma-HCH transport system substrate-binding protein